MEKNTLLQFPESVPGIIYGILGLSITIATFLPALVYSYNKDLLENLRKPQLEKNERVWKRVIGFILTNDLLLTQSMIQVLFASAYGVLIFTIFIIKLDKNFEIILFTFPALFILCLQWSFSFFYSKKNIELYRSKSININGSEINITKYWEYFKQTEKLWKYFTSINLLITTICVLFIFYFQEFGFAFISTYYVIVFFICFLSLVLIIYSVSWLIPLVVYSPLTSEVEEYIVMFEQSIISLSEDNNILKNNNT